MMTMQERTKTKMVAAVAMLELNRFNLQHLETLSESCSKAVGRATRRTTTNCQPRIGQMTGLQKVLEMRT